ncbi:PEP-CTERM sorting domain-containing protein [Laspinema olomoucense]|uniref:PEP-CTERM sorting domain-containing protein n=1 Tax=Laspinema olomoucense TaxID=3231600 RepID=UPI0021BB3922|nr:PEP-CTERM sorting domain-containing protein [Laspinema sp. D3a]MCT7990854.1 PEP-CTERM sorting domain-containing protein [Laspinema sp. D3a]
MNIQSYSLTAAAATLIGIFSAIPAQAFTFDTGGISFNRNTTVEFNFNQSDGLYRSELKILEVLDGGQLSVVKDLFKEVQAHDGGNAYTGNNVGTCGLTVLVCEGSFTFEANKQYTLGLFSYHRTTNNSLSTVYSTSFLNGGEAQQAVFGSWGSIGSDTTFFKNAANYQASNPFGDWVKIGFDDTGNDKDQDFQDFTVSARAVAVPEPTALVGLGIMAGAMAISRRGKSNQEIL